MFRQFGAEDFYYHSPEAEQLFDRELLFETETVEAAVTRAAANLGVLDIAHQAWGGLGVVVGLHSGYSRRAA